MSVNQIWVGPEPLRRHHVRRAVGAGVRGIDCADDPAAAVDAACSGGLFAATVHLRNLDVLEPAALARIADAAGHGAGPVVGECDKLPAAARRALGERFTVHQVALGRGAAARRVLQDIAGLLGVTLASPVADDLAGRCEAEPGRAVGVLEALAAAGYTDADRALVGELLGTTASPGFPWHLLGLIEQGRAERAGPLLDQVDAIPAIGFLAKRILAASLVAEDPGVSPEDLDRLLGGLTPAAASGAASLAARLGTDRCRELLGVLAAADLAAKRGNPEAALLLAVGHLVRLLGT